MCQCETEEIEGGDDETKVEADAYEGEIVEEVAMGETTEDGNTEYSCPLILKTSTVVNEKQCETKKMEGGGKAPARKVNPEAGLNEIRSDTNESRTGQKRIRPKDDPNESRTGRKWIQPKDDSNESLTGRTRTGRKSDWSSPTLTKADSVGSRSDETDPDKS